MYVGEMPAPEGLEPLVANTVSEHSGAPAQCATCHMFRKDFETEEAPAISGHQFTVNLEACNACHPAGVSDTLAALQDEVQTALDDIEARLGDPATWQYSATGGPPEADDAQAGETTQDDVSDEVKQVRFLWSYVSNDGSLGVHNPGYVRAILAKADEILDGIGQ